MWSHRLVGELSEGQLLPVRLQRSRMIWRRMKSHSREVLGVNGASAVMNLLELRGLPRVNQEILHQRTWQERSEKVRIGNGRRDFCTIPGRSIRIFAATELPAKILDLSQQ